MARNIAVGIDIGTYQIKVVVAEYGNNGERNAPRILGTGFSESKGIRHGYIINSHDATRSIKLAIAQAESSSGIQIKRAYLGIGGVSVETTTATGKVIISRGDSEVTELDLDNALSDSERNIPGSLSVNRRILHTIPISYVIDGHEVLGHPIGMKGTKLEINTLFITCLEQHLDDLIQAVESAGIDVEDVMASPLAASLVVLNKAQKMAGCVLANIGAATVSIAIFENNIPIGLKIFPIGSTDITNDIALGLRIPLEEAEQVKLGSLGTGAIPRKKLEEIIVARLSDIFELIEAHLKKIGRNGLLPAGIILTGGGSGITTIEDLAKASLRLPSKIGELHVATSAKGHIIDSTWSVAYGLCIWGFTGGDAASITGNTFGKAKTNLMTWIKQFLP
ncbi:cell division protein FtsA [Candidatus Wolfebacteria bacterium]|nr:MAG: cell division protein FtsA [Candidatus Wolfebacteria bacterium]